LGLGLTAVALAPVGLWLTIALPGGLLRRAMATGRAAGDSRPNIILITVEAFRPDRIGAYGATAGLTPNLDAFAREATRYESAYVSSSWTVPSLAAQLTGLSPSQCVVGPLARRTGSERTLSYVLAKGAPLLPEKLRRAGYATAAELTNNFLCSEGGWSRGFDCFRNESAEGGPLSELTLAQHVTERASEWLSLNRREPFFLWVHYFDPHVPYDSPDTPPGLRAQYPREWVAHRLVWLSEMRYAREPARSRYMEFCRRMYDQEVRYTDRWVGEMLKSIRAAGLYDRSLIAITADHGEELFDRTERGGVEHGHSMHEAVLWVPLLVKWPQRVQADAQIGQTVSVDDLQATFLHFAGVQGSRNNDPQGLPLRDGFRGDEVFAEWIYYGAEQTALITDDYKIIYDPGTDAATGKFQVYDRRTDREERHDLARSPVATDLRLRLQQLTRAALERRRLTTASYGARPPVLSDKAKRDLRSLGYIGR
jgi:arylsulfatase